jgi:hypothetical protein
MPESLTNTGTKAGGSVETPSYWRELDCVAAEAELRLRIPSLKTAVKKIEKAKTVSKKTLEYKFSI